MEEHSLQQSVRIKKSYLDLAFLYKLCNYWLQQQETVACSTVHFIRTGITLLLRRADIDIDLSTATWFRQVNPTESRTCVGCHIDDITVLPYS